MEKALLVIEEMARVTYDLDIFSSGHGLTEMFKKLEGGVNEG